jgi:hypothetical protein
MEKPTPSAAFFGSLGLFIRLLTSEADWRMIASHQGRAIAGGRHETPRAIPVGLRGGFRCVVGLYPLLEVDPQSLPELRPRSD